MLVKVVILVLVKVGDAEDEGPVVGEDDEEVDEEAHNVLLPAETIDRKESVELWKSRNETDVIVADHDVFGTDENDEDSLDSLLRFCSPERLFFYQQSLNHFFRVEPGESFREGGSRLTFGHSSVIPGENTHSEKESSNTTSQGSWKTKMILP